MSDKKKSAPKEDSAENTADVFDLSDFDTEDTNTGPISGSATDAETQKQIVDLTNELEKAKKDFLYLRADFDNYKKAAIKERSDLMKYGSERLVVELLNVLDTFDQALGMELTSENAESFRKGIELLRTEFANVVERQGVTSIESLGQPFDPNLHEALSAEPTDEVKPGHISKVFKKAYKMHDKVIRPAQVVVAKEPEKKNE